MHSTAATYKRLLDIPVSNNYEHMNTIILINFAEEIDRA